MDYFVSVYCNIKERASSLENIQFLSERQGGRARPLRSNKANRNLISKIFTVDYKENTFFILNMNREGLKLENINTLFAC